MSSRESEVWWWQQNNLQWHSFLKKKNTHKEIIALCQCFLPATSTKTSRYQDILHNHAVRDRYNIMLNCRAQPKV